MKPLQDIEEEALKEPAVLVGFFTSFTDVIKGPQKHNTVLLKRLFDFANEPQPAALTQTQDETFEMDSAEIIRVAEKLYNQLKP